MPLHPRLLVLAMALAACGAQASNALAKKYGCLGCHAVATKLVGPAYKDVAERYAGQPDATALLAKKIRTGGAGTWGDMPMPPQAAVTETDARRLATWVLQGAK